MKGLPRLVWLWIMASSMCAPKSTGVCILRASIMVSWSRRIALGWTWRSSPAKETGASSASLVVAASFIAVTWFSSSFSSLSIGMLSLVSICLELFSGPRKAARRRCSQRISPECSFLGCRHQYRLELSFKVVFHIFFQLTHILTTIVPIYVVVHRHYLRMLLNYT